MRIHYAHLSIGYTTEGGYTLGDPGRLYFRPRNASPIAASTALVEVGRWTHVAVAFDGSVLKFYIDGEEAGTVAGNWYVPDDLASTHDRLGAWGGGSTLDGKMKDVRVWRVARTQDQIRDTMHKVLDGSEAGLQAYWRLDEGMGTTVQDRAGGYDGTLLGGASWARAKVPHGDTTAQTQQALRSIWQGHPAALSAGLDLANDTFLLDADDMIFWGHDGLAGTSGAFDDVTPGSGFSIVDDHLVATVDSTVLGSYFTLGTLDSDASPLGNWPTAVTLASFTAQPAGDTIRLAWETASEADLLGFYVYRAAPDREAVRLAGDLLPAQAPGSPGGACYTFADETAVAGVTYRYWLYAVDVRGDAARHGPVEAALAAYRVFLPVVVRCKTHGGRKPARFYGYWADDELKERHGQSRPTCVHLVAALWPADESKVQRSIGQRHQHRRIA